MNDLPFQDEVIKDMIAVAREAGQQAMTMRQNPEALGIERKTDNSVVTEADKKNEALIKQRLVSKHGGDFIGEETGRTVDAGNSNKEWIVDPIDGTTNYSAGTLGEGNFASDPNWGVSIALRENGKVTHGVVYLPETGQLYFAQEGKGAYVVNQNGDSKKLELSSSIPHRTSIEIGGGFREADSDELSTAIRKTYSQETGGGQRCLGSVVAGMIQVATGARGAFTQGAINAHDYSAASLIAVEAGAVMSIDAILDDSKGREAVMVSHPQVHNQLVTVYNQMTGKSMPFMDAEGAGKRAEVLLSQKTKGPNRVMAYAVVNEEREREDGTTEPFFNPESSKPRKLAYAFFETDRTGVPILNAPGGAQDMIVTNPVSQETFPIELGKKAALNAVLEKLELAAPEGATTKDLEHYVVQKYLENGWDVKIESPFKAAVREAKEEQGIDLSNPENYIGAPLQFENNMMAKRTLQAIEEATDGPVFDISAMQDLGNVRTAIRGIKENAPEGVATETPHMTFAVHVPDFSNAELVNEPNKVENKIKGREGKIFYEKGRFVTLEQMEASLENALEKAKTEAANDNAFAGQEVLANLSGLDTFRQIEGTLVAQLQEQGVYVSSSSRLRDNKPDAVRNEYAGKAELPAELASKRQVSARMGGRAL